MIGSDSGAPEPSAVASAVAGQPGGSAVVLADSPAARASAERAAVVSPKLVGVLFVGHPAAALAAATAFNPMSSLEENMGAMGDAASSCRAGVVTPGAGADAGSAVVAETDRLLAGMAGAGVVTLVAGAGVRHDEAAAAGRALRRAHPDLHVDVVTGGPPGSHYLIGVE